MSTTTAPTPLTPGVAATINPPASAPQLAAVVVQNASPYTLAVTIAGQQSTLQPYTADLYPTSGTGSPIALVPSNPDNTTGVSSNAEAIWYGPDEIPTTTAYPAALTPPPVAVGVAIANQQNALPMSWLSLTTPGAVGGLAVVTSPAITDPLWLVYRLTIACTSTSMSSFGLYLGAVAAANLRDQNSIGNNNSADMAAPLQFTAGEQIVAQWAACSPGAVGTVNIGYKVPS